MSKILEYYQKLETTKEEAQELFTRFINFYLYLKNMHDRKKISKENILLLDKSLSFTEHVHECDTEKYLEDKYNTIEEFLTNIEEEYNKFSKNFLSTFELPLDAEYESVSDLIIQTYIAYACTRYQQNIKNTKKLETDYPETEYSLVLPKYIPDENVNIKNFLEITCGIKRKAKDGKTIEWFNIFNNNLSIRAIIDTYDGQIAKLYVNKQEYIEVPMKLINTIKKAIKKGTSI